MGFDSSDEISVSTASHARTWFWHPDLSGLFNTEILNTVSFSSLSRYSTWVNVKINCVCRLIQCLSLLSEPYSHTFIFLTNFFRVAYLAAAGQELLQPQ